MKYNKYRLFVCLFVSSSVLCSIVNSLQTNTKSAAPILDIDDELVGYIGSISERNILVDLKPHLSIKNIDDINGICSYHVFKPNSEEFPFTIDIKDKQTGEAVIEVIKRQSDSSTTTKSSLDSNDESSGAGGQTSSNDEEHDKTNHKSIVLDCKKRKEFNFLIQAHDCSSPSLYSNKVPVKIAVIDHDDYALEFEQAGIYQKSLTESDDLYESFMGVKAKDDDCTNNGYACAYNIAINDEIDEEVIKQKLPFKIDNSGQLSTTRAVKRGEIYDFKVRAYDCVSKNSFVETQVHIEIVEPCVPQWIDYSNEVISTQTNTNLFETLKATSCVQTLESKTDSTCQIESVNSKITLQLDPSIKNVCDVEKCDSSNSAESASDASLTSKVVLFSGVNKAENTINVNNNDDDSIEDDEDDDENKIITTNNLKPDQDLEQPLNKVPLSYRSFSKQIENAQKIDFDGKFGDEFVLSAWLRRPPNAEKSIKEQVFCGTDSLLLNRHHYGLYFYRGNVKFLLRREPTGQAKPTKPTNTDSNNGDDFESNEVFYPSLWEWSLYEPLLSDAKWHFYEVKVNYPNASLYIDGVRYVENTTNSDIIDAYELNEVNGGPISTYIGACYHARTKTLIDHFEGDIGNVVLTRKEKKQPTEKKQQLQQQIDCSKNCKEYIELNMVGNENYIQSIENSNQNEISIQTSNLNDMTQIISKINYVNKQSYPQMGQRTIKLTTTIQCGNNGKQVNLKELNIALNLKRQKQEYNVQLEGAKQIYILKSDLENGIEPFKDISILKIPINKVDDASNSFESNTNNVNNDDISDTSSSSESSDENTQDQKAIKLSKCLIRVVPQRNLIDPLKNNEKVMYLQNLKDEFGFSFEETLDLVTISGIQPVESYETFIRHLTYVITNINENTKDNLFIINNKQFFISCVRNEPNIETNTILIQLNVTNEKKKSKVDGAPQGFLAHKQMQKLVVSENEDDILQQKKSDDVSFTSKNSDASSPLVVALIVMCSCAIGFLLVFGAIKLHSNGIIGGRRRPLPNEENPQMEWDDSGLNITENPLETLEANKANALNGMQHAQIDYEEEYSSTEDDESNEEDEQYSSEEEPEKVIDRELEWDDTSIDIKIKDKQLQQQQLSNKNLSNKSESDDSPNKFV